jgi:oxygen-dependent protoporphyrinogen oxidase
LESKFSPVGQNRFIYYPDHLVRMPGPGADIFDQLWSVLTEPVFKGVIKGIFGEVARPPPERSLEDESVASFLNRRLGNTKVSENIVSAVLHGIYAGDINKLSAKSLLPWVWEAERQFGSVGDLLYNSWTGRRQGAFSKLICPRDIALLKDLHKNPHMAANVEAMKPISVWSFENGISTLTDALAKSLDADPRVQIKQNHAITKLAYDGNANTINVSTRLVIALTSANIIDLNYQEPTASAI